MSLTAIKRQAVGFRPEIPNNYDNTDLCQLVNRTDLTAFQLASTELDGVEQIVNSSFDSPLASGSTTATSPNKLINAGAIFFDNGIEPFMTVENKTDSTITDITAIDSQTQLSLLSDIFTSGESYEISGWNYDSVWSTDAVNGTATKSASGNSPFIQKIGVLNDQFYKIVVTISSLSASGIARVRLGGITLPDITQNGTFTLYLDFWRETPINDLIEVVADLSATTFVIEIISVKLLSSAGYRIQDLDGNVVDTNFDATDILHGAETLPAQSNFIQVNIDWAAIADDCYELCIIDTGQKNIVVNGRFNGNASSDWAISGSSKWNFQEGKAIGDATGASSPSTDRNLDQALSLPTGHKYSLTYTVLGLTSGTVRAFTDDIGLTVRSANGTFTEIIDVDDDLFPDQTFLRFTLSDTTGKLNIDNVILFEINETKDCVLTSECFKLLDNHAKTLQVTNTMNGNAFGLDYINFPNFVQSFRHGMELHYMETEHWKNKTWRDSRGDPIRVTVTNVEITRLHMTLMKDYMHRYMSNALTSDGFFVDGVQYGYEANVYTPEKSLDTILSVGNAQIIEQDQFMQNNNC